MKIFYIRADGRTKKTFSFNNRFAFSIASNWSWYFIGLFAVVKNAIVLWTSDNALQASEYLRCSNSVFVSVFGLLISIFCPLIYLKHPLPAFAFVHFVGFVLRRTNIAAANRFVIDVLRPVDNSPANKPFFFDMI